MNQYTCMYCIILCYLVIHSFSSCRTRKELCGCKTRFREKVSTERKFIPPVVPNNRSLISFRPRFVDYVKNEPYELEMGVVDSLWDSSKLNPKKLPREIHVNYNFKLTSDYQKEYAWSETEKKAWSLYDPFSRWREQPAFFNNYWR